MIHKFIKTKSRLATIMVGFNAGSKNEKKFGYNLGISHMLEHSFFKGTKKRSWEMISDDISFLGGHTNAYTSYDKVAYYITVPVENIDSATEILSDMILNLDVKEEDFVKERSVVMEEMLSSDDDIGSFIWSKTRDIFFDNYLKDPIIGTEETINKFTLDEVYKYKKQFCNVDEAIIAISGNMKKKDAMSVMEKYFGKPNGKIKRYASKKSSHPESQIIEIEKPGIEHCYVNLCIPAKIETEKDSIIADVLNAYLGSGMDSVLFKEVREKNGLVYSISSSSSSWGSDGSIQSIFFSTREENVEKACSIIKEQVQKLKEELIDEKALQRIKNKIKTGFYSFLESSSSLCSYEIERVIYKEMTIKKHLEIIEKCTVEDIREAANKIFTEESNIMVVCKGENNVED